MTKPRLAARLAALWLALCMLLGSTLPAIRAYADNGTIAGASAYRSTLNYSYNLTVNDLGSCRCFQITLTGYSAGGSNLGSVFGFCADHGLHCSTGTAYTEAGTVSDDGLAKVLVWYDRMKQSDALAAYLFTQIYIWSYQKGSDIRANVSTAFSEYYGSQYGAQASGWYDDVQRTSTAGSTITVWSSGKAEYQRLYTITSTPYEDMSWDTLTATATAPENVTLSLQKTDSESGAAVSGCTFNLYRDDTKIAAVTTDAAGTASYAYATSYTCTSGTYSYVKNYANISPAQQAEADTLGYYHSEAEARAAAQADANAKAAAAAAQSHTYKAVETASNAAYVLDSTEKSAAVTGSGETTFRLTNAPKKFRVTLAKADAETGSAQGDASLAGAVYGIYRNNTLVDSFATDAGGSFTTGYYRCAVDSTEDIWTLQEITPSEGYLLDEAVYPLNTSVQNITVAQTDLAVRSLEQVIKGRISLIKHSDDGSTQIETPETGAVFQVYRTAAGSFETAAETERDTLTCDENGYAETKDLPYGTYTVHQVSGWEGRELIRDFTVAIGENGKVYRYLLNNAEFSGYLKVVKQDAESGAAVPYAGAAFQIRDPAGNLVSMTCTYPSVTTIDTFYTSADGTLVTPEVLPYGLGYTLVEVTAPYGYVLDSTPVSFDVTEVTAVQEDSIVVIPVAKNDQAQKGIIRIAKSGEVFSSVLQQEDTYQPQYTVQGLAGATYSITAAEDIITPDGTLRAAAGTVVDTITTGADGTAASTELYLGKYLVAETQAPGGYVLGTAAQTAELTYAGQEVALTAADVSCTDVRQKAAVSLKKTLEQDGAFHIGQGSEW